ncbi:MAG: fucose isomerase [Candidatus Glassbacteria bacterium]|nr:fucose isomerase [Candidatus Glassbacteria bacterium]
MDNVPRIKLGLVAASRDCFPRALSLERAGRVSEECGKLGLDVTLCDTMVESEEDSLSALKELEDKGLNALAVYLGNFGPEGPVSLLAQRFEGPVMVAAAAEESADKLIQGRGDAYCGLLSTRYNLALRKVKVYLPEFPVGEPEEVAGMVERFIPVARVVAGVRGLKVISFGPRPQDFYTCHAPLEPLYELGVEVMENSELDLYDVFCMAEAHPMLKETEQDMQAELGENIDPRLLDRMARLELALTDYCKDYTGASSYVALADKCWPAFEKYFGCVPCYVNSRLSARGIPVACEADIYGAVSQYLATAATVKPTTLLDINSTVPRDMFRQAGAAAGSYSHGDLFMGFHCGNTPKSCLKTSGIGYQLIMHRLMEPDSEPDITRGTLEGQIAPGEITIMRVQATPGAGMAAYAAEGEVLDIDPRTFGGTGVIAIPQMARFYRHVLLEKAFPHHTAVAFDRAGHTVSAALKLLGVDDISFNLPSATLYPGESPYW